MADFIHPSKREEFKLLQIEGKRLASNGDLEASLEKFELAKQICPTSKVLQRIDKLKQCLNLVHEYCEEHHSVSQMSDNLASSTEVYIKGSTVEEPKDNKTKNVAELKILSDIQNIQNNEKLSEKNSKSSDLSPQSQLKFKKLKHKAKQLAYAGQMQEAVDCFKMALKISDCPKVQTYIKEIESAILINNKQARECEDSATGKKLENSSTFVKKSPENSAPAADEMNESYTERKRAEVRLLYEEARDLAADAHLTEALKLLKKAQTIYATEKVKKRIDKIEEHIAANANDTDENEMIEIVNGFSVYHKVYEKLYPYQREGVAWMWKLYKMGKGGILGDDMGLGKTFQVIAFISGMIDANLVKHVLIIMPVSLLKNWEKEFKKWCSGISVHDFHSGTKRERERNKLRVQRRGHVLLTSYGMLVNNVNILTKIDDTEFVWDYVILDEGHKIKNPTKTTKAVYEIPAKNRLVLTGTPIQNNLKELWSLYDFVHQGTLLGSLKTFKLQYEIPITRSREKDATVGEKRLGSEMAENLKALIKPYFLRRTKEEIRENNDKDVEDLGNQMDNMKITQLTTKKNDLILWTYMSEPQIAIYKDFLHSDAVKSILVSKRSPLVELTTLKKICDHPRLLSQRACFHLGLNGDLQKGALVDLDDESTLASSIENVTDECLLKESGKLKLVIDLLENLKENGHRTLVFSLSRKILDMIHRILSNKKWKVMRLDGTVTKITDRQQRIMTFQRDSSFPVFLLTTQVGGVGITLTAADRVIIYDPSWNPATDAQAVDRAYRIGQEKDIIVYRLITCGTVEEKIYRRQIFKDSITRQATGATDPFRYFSKQELRELFSLDDPYYSATQTQLHEMHSSQRYTYRELENHLEFLKNLNIFGISDHDLMFTKQIEDHTEDNDPNGISEHFIKQKVAAAHQQITMEASVVAEGIRLAGTYNRPYQEAVPLFKKVANKDAYKPPILPEVVIDLTEDAQDDVFSLNTRKKTSVSRNNSDDDIQMFSPDKIHGNSSNEKLSPARKKSESTYTEKNQFSFASSTQENINPFSIKVSSDSANAVDYVGISEKFEDCAISDTVMKTEKLRKSSFIKPGGIGEELVTNHSGKTEMSLNDTQVKNTSTHSIDEQEQKISLNLRSPDITLNLHEKFQANLTHFMNEDIADLSFDQEEPVVTVKKGRKSCARPSTMLISDSDTSCQNSAESSVNLASENEDTASDSDDSSNNASLSFVPDSASNSPQTPKYPKDHEYVHASLNETPPTSVRVEPELLSGKSSIASNTSNFMKTGGSIRRITPLKVNNNQIQENSSFAQAMASSLIITPDTSPKNEQSHIKSNISDSDMEDEDSYETPLKVVKKTKVKQLLSDSEESDVEPEDYSTVEHQVKQSNQGHLISSSDEEEERSNSELDSIENNAKGKKIEAVSNHSVLEIDSDNENDVQSDLERTFATCKEKAESDSDDPSAQDSDDYNDSDESGSIFSEEN